MTKIYGVDAESLADANKCILGHLQAAGLERKEVYAFVRQVIAGRGDYYDELTNAQKAKVYQDLAKFKFVAENENGFIKEASELVKMVGRTMGIQDITDEMESNALLSIRRSYFYYEDTKCNLKRFCFAGIQQEYRQIIREKKVKKNKVWRSRVHLDSTNVEELDPKGHVTTCNPEPEEETQDVLLDTVFATGLSSIQIIQKIAEHAKFTIDERLLIEIMLKNGGNRNWVNDYLSQTGLSMTKQGVYYRRDTLIRRLRDEVSNNGLNIFNS